MRHTLVLALALAGTIALLASPLDAAETNRFRLKVGTSMSGTDEFSIARTEGGFHLTGTSRTVVGGKTIEATLDQTLEADRSLRRYRLEVATPSGPQVIEAIRQKETVEMKVFAGGQPRAKGIPFAPGLVLLDNLVTAHIQLLLDQLGGKPPAGPITLLVPQALAAIPGKVALEGEDSGMLDGKPVARLTPEKLDAIVDEVRP